MIVVAIIGILAAVAIPGFMSYIKSSKTSEAKTNLNSLLKGAISYFEAEHYDDTGMTAVSKQYPSSLDAIKYVGKEPTEETIGVKQSPISDAVKAQLADVPWGDLNFKLTSPFYYTYAYKSDGQEVETYTEGEGASAVTKTRIKAGGTKKISHFQATACASISDEKDSVFYINGYSDGSASPIIEGTVGDHCYKATVPTDPS